MIPRRWIGGWLLGVEQTTRAWDRNILYDAGLFLSLGYVGTLEPGYYATLFSSPTWLTATSLEDARNKVQTLLFWSDREC